MDGFPSFHSPSSRSDRVPCLSGFPFGCWSGRGVQYSHLCPRTNRATPFVSSTWGPWVWDRFVPHGPSSSGDVAPFLVLRVVRLDWRVVVGTCPVCTRDVFDWGLVKSPPQGSGSLFFPAPGFFRWLNRAGCSPSSVSRGVHGCVIRSLILVPSSLALLNCSL